MQPLKHQLEKSEKCWEILKVFGYVYLAGKPRSGKTLTSILIAEKSTVIKSILVITKKAAISGWDKFINDKELNLKHNYYVTNYEQVGKWDNEKAKAQLKLLPKNYDLVIIDESHNLGTVGKPSGRYKIIKSLCYNMPHIHLSGTAIVESPNSIYHQMSISKFNPFKFINFYKFFKVYGEPYYIKAAGRDIAQYDRYKPILLDKIDEFTVYMTQEDAGISKDLQATDKLHYVELLEGTKKLYNIIQEDMIAKVGTNIFYDINGECSSNRQGINIENMKKDLVCDTTMKLRTSLHMLESGVAKIGDEYIELGNLEKVNYVKENFGDCKDVGIMSHFIGERKLLERHFKNACIYSSTSHAEGVDLSHLNHFVIISSAYSGSKFIQRRDRIVNINGSNTTIVNHILVKKAISEQVYKKVSKKEDFNNSTYEANSL
tara:strand:- start:1373 stop:2668 length:1296 start_codon:yes stop_codon:yes gene_type:complete